MTTTDHGQIIIWVHYRWNPNYRLSTSLQAYISYNLGEKYLWLKFLNKLSLSLLAFLIGLKFSSISISFFIKLSLQFYDLHRSHWEVIWSWRIHLNKILTCETQVMTGMYYLRYIWYIGYIIKRILFEKQNMAKIPKSVKWAKKISKKGQIFAPYLIDVRTINENREAVKRHANRLFPPKFPH